MLVSPVRIWASAPAVVGQGAVRAEAPPARIRALAPASGTGRKWLRGRASPCQGEGRGFKSRLPLHSDIRRQPPGGCLFPSPAEKPTTTPQPPSGKRARVERTIGSERALLQSVCCRSGGMVDATVSKTVEGNLMPVRLRPSAPLPSAPTHPCPLHRDGGLHLVEPGAVVPEDLALVLVRYVELQKRVDRLRVP